MPCSHVSRFKDCLVSCAWISTPKGPKGIRCVEIVEVGQVVVIVVAPVIDSNGSRVMGVVLIKGKWLRVTRS